MKNPNVTVTLKRSEWKNVYEILRDLDIEAAGIEHDDERLQSILVLINILMNKGD